jgi:hypothetical protein
MIEELQHGHSKPTGPAAAAELKRRPKPRAWGHHNSLHVESGKARQWMLALARLAKEPTPFLDGRQAANCGPLFMDVISRAYPRRRNDVPYGAMQP